MVHGLRRVKAQYIGAGPKSGGRVYQLCEVLLQDRPHSLAVK